MGEGWGKDTVQSIPGGSVPCTEPGSLHRDGPGRLRHLLGGVRRRITRECSEVCAKRTTRCFCPFPGLQASHVAAPGDQRGRERQEVWEGRGLSPRLRLPPPPPVFAPLVLGRGRCHLCGDSRPMGILGSLTTGGK